jgi:hypothetical protein
MYNRGKNMEVKARSDPTTKGKREKSLPLAWIFIGGGASSVSRVSEIESEMRGESTTIIETVAGQMGSLETSTSVSLREAGEPN